METCYCIIRYCDVDKSKSSQLSQVQAKSLFKLNVDNKFEASPNQVPG